MKTKVARVILSLFLVSGLSLAQEIKPVAVSPGNEDGLARVGERCPTFSWSAVGWAAGYRVAVFEAADDFGAKPAGAQDRTYESLALAAAPVLTQEIKGKALSWTPSEAQGLNDGALYVWYVQARDASGNGLWSAGRAFRVELERTSLIGIEERVTKRLRTRGVAADVIADVEKELRGGARADAISKGFTLKPQDKARPGDSSGNGLPSSGWVRDQGNEGDANGNTYYGTSAGSSLTTGRSNALIGYLAGHRNTTGNENTFLGFEAGAHNTAASGNTFIGTYAGMFNTTGIKNTFLGLDSGFRNETGRSNTFLGYQAGSSNTSGNFNTFVGDHSGFKNTTGHNNTFLGLNAGLNNVTGSFNVALGQGAGQNSTGSRNVLLGYQAGINETGSNKLYISNSDSSFPLIFGEFKSGFVAINGMLGLGVQNPVFPLQLDGGAYCDGKIWVDASSRSLKENIRDLALDDARTTLAELAPVRYNYKTDAGEECLGFIAEDVPALVATGDRKGLSPMDIVAVLTRVVQEQQKENDELREIVRELRADIEALKNRTR